MRKSILVTPLAALLAMGVSGIYASAQDLTSAVLAGIVTGPDNRPMQGVRVYITSPVLLTPRDARTDAGGNFRFQLLPPGRYTVTYSMDGFISRKAEMTLIAGVVASGSIKLRSMDVMGETVEITAEASNMITADKTDTVVQTAFTSDRLEEIGAGRGVAALQELTPGIVGQITDTQHGFNIRGSLNRGNKIMQDGQLIGDMLYGVLLDTGQTVEDLIESIAVIQSPLNAKLGNTDGGIISITTRRGGNMFSGSLRYSGKRGEPWGSQVVSYPDMLGYSSMPSNPKDDWFSRSWQYAITGPIVPNYLTFTLGGNITPTTYSKGPYSLTGPNNIFSLQQTWWRWDGPNASLARMGTFYMDNDPSSPWYGNVVRASNLGAMTSIDAQAYGSDESGNNSFSLYFQPHPNHQITYYYTQGYHNQNVNGSFMMGDTDPEYGTFTNTRAWNISYKAVLGSAGVLDVRYGRSQNYRDQRKAGRESIQIRTDFSYWDTDADGSPRPNLLGSMVNKDNMTMADFNKFLANGIIDHAWNTRGYAGTSPLFFNTTGINFSGSNGSGVNSINANYQHMLSLKGNHIIDVGFNIEDADAPGIPSGARWYASPVGQISPTLQSSQIGLMNMASLNLPAGTGVRAPVGRYAGRYIVFDVRNSRVSDIEPHVLLRPRTGGDIPANWLEDGPVWDMANNRLHPQLYGNTHLLEDLPFMNERWGSDIGDMLNVVSSYYINDMWTINQHHSVMLGLRGDGFKLKDSARTVHDYLKLTPRFEYKFDLLGNQRHLFAASYAQFHQMAQLQLYWPFIQTKWGNTNYRLWTGDAVDPSKKARGYYLVDKDDVLNVDNYGIVRNTTLSGSLYGDVDKGFKPPTSTDIGLRYRHAFANGGYISVAFNTRSWSDLYDYFPGEVFEYTAPDGAKSYRIKTVLKNTNDYSRSYNGLELQWDIPVTRRIAFGGSYTHSSFKHNQTAVGTQSDPIVNTEDQKKLQTPWWYEERFSQPVVVNGQTVYQFGARDWSPAQKQGYDFKITYYLMFNVSQGRTRSNFSLRGSYTGPTTSYDRVPIHFGVAVIPPITDFPGSPNASTFLDDGLYVPFNSYTGGETFANHLTYNLNVPLTKRLFWFVNINIENVFNHVAKATSVPGGTSPTAGLIRPWNIRLDPNRENLQNWNTVNWNPFRDGWTWPSGNLEGYFNRRNPQLRTISMSSGIRF